MSNPLASTIFTTGAKDNLATVDVYKKTLGNKAVITAVQSLAKKADFSETTQNLLGKVLGGSKTDLFSAVLKTTKFDTEGLKTRLLGDLQGVKGSFNSLSTKIQDKFTSTFSSSVGKASDQMSVGFGGTNISLTGSSFADVDAYKNLVNDFTEQDSLSLVDKTAIGSFTGSLVAQASSFGIPNAFSTLTSGITDVNVLNQTLKTSVDTLASNADISGLMDISSNSKVSSTLGILFPDFGKTVASKYSSLTSGSSGSKKQSWNNMLTLFNNVNSEWDTFKRMSGSQKGVNILNLLGASNDFKVLIKAGISAYEENEERRKWKDCYALAQFYRQTTVEAEIKRHFPTLALEATMNASRMTYGTSTQKKDSGILSPTAMKTAKKIIDVLTG